MPNREHKSNIATRIALEIQTIATDTTTNGDIIDLQGYDSCTFHLFMGALTDGDYTVLIQEGDASNLSDAAAVDDADLDVTEASVSLTADTDDQELRSIAYTGSKRYVRFNIVSTSTSSGAVMGAIATLGHPSLAPVTAGASS